MGIFSFLFGGKKKAKPDVKPAVVDKPAPAASVVITAPVAPSVGVTQAKLRLKLAAALRAGDQPAAYEAAKGLADIQVRAGRRNVARGWQQQADRIKQGMPA
jgi:hypothetical protein